MKKIHILFLIVFLSLSYNSYSQKLDTILNGYLSPIVRTSGSGPNFNFKGIFRNNSIGLGFDTTGTNLNIIVATDGKCYQLPVTNITEIQQPLVRNTVIQGTAVDLSGELSTIPTGVAAFVDLTDSLKLMPYVYKLPEDLQACLINRNYLIIDSLALNDVIGTTQINDSVYIQLGNGQTLFTGVAVGSAGTNNFDSDRAILRIPEVNTNIGGNTIEDWLEWWYFTPPTFSAFNQSPSGQVYEVGIEENIRYLSVVSNPSGATITSHYLLNLTTGDTLYQEPDVPYTNTIKLTENRFVYYTPLQTPVDTFEASSYSFRFFADWESDTESGTIQTEIKTIQAVYPVLYGMVADTATAFADPYGTLTKLVQTEENKTVSYTGTGLIVYGFPQTWSDTNLSSIIDPNGFNVTASFTRVDYPTVTSTGLPNNYSDVPYVFYFLNTGSTTTSASNYTFNR